VFDFGLHSPSSWPLVAVKDLENISLRKHKM